MGVVEFQKTGVWSLLLKTRRGFAIGSMPSHHAMRYAAPGFSNQFQGTKKLYPMALVELVEGLLDAWEYIGNTHVHMIIHH